MYLLPLWLSFFSFLVAICMGRSIGSNGVFYNAISCLFLCVLISIYMFYEVCLNGVCCTVNLFDWLCLDLVDVHWCFMYDSLSVSMLLVINIISLCAHIYSIEYMSSDIHITRFVSYLSLFTFFMLLLVLSDNLLQLFVGFECVGICSYLLINFWFTRVQANNAALFAVLVNKIGDIALLICCMWLCCIWASSAIAPLHADESTSAFSWVMSRPLCELYAYIIEDPKTDPAMIVMFQEFDSLWIFCTEYGDRINATHCYFSISELQYIHNVCDLYLPNLIELHDKLHSKEFIILNLRLAYLIISCGEIDAWACHYLSLVE